jgi:hypothetical protein
MPEERGYMEAINSVATTFATQPVCNTARARREGRENCLCKKQERRNEKDNFLLL